MNFKRFFGVLLAVLGISGLMYSAMLFSDTSGETKDVKLLLLFCVLEIIFFVGGINLVKSTKGES